jgi:hypothetical protein
MSLHSIVATQSAAHIAQKLYHGHREAGRDAAQALRARYGQAGIHPGRRVQRKGVQGMD